MLNDTAGFGGGFFAERGGYHQRAEGDCFVVLGKDTRRQLAGVDGLGVFCRGSTGFGGKLNRHAADGCDDLAPRRSGTADLQRIAGGKPGFIRRRNVNDLHFGEGLNGRRGVARGFIGDIVCCADTVLHKRKDIDAACDGSVVGEQTALGAGNLFAVDS